MAGMFSNGENIHASLSQPRAARVPQGVESDAIKASRFARLDKAMPEIMGNG